ncbi:glycerophosphoryl diester phosphodiesterase [Cupriavidus gilardii J11]|uniref:glycerophosphodiester phosphodiesterase n=1 Tax=Cupriavidus gilardii J11 TaxID=936133 RepID=A0A562BGE2_9BURK|nr:glycerophosphodiester phosphodiesterase [Cupriavidus gilardii]TWG83970.1 glycerophosphoryl diester phosphodiesterase [Cupriavidus gilardii J11]
MYPSRVSLRLVCPWPRGGLLSAVLVAVLASGCAFAPREPAPAPAPEPVRIDPAPQRPKALVIGHRGASALRPEHTLAAYAKAIEDGADFVEPDLVMTKDGVLVARHENEIGGTTNVSTLPQFADRKRIKVIDGERLTGWFTEDFTLAELKTLRARERIPDVRPANVQYNDRYEIPTFDEIIRLVADASRRTGRTIGLYPETKHSSYFRGIGLPLEEAVVKALRGHPYTRTAPVYLQSFETANLRTLRAQIGKSMPNVRLMQLIGNPARRPADWRLAGDTRTYADMMTPLGLREVATYADGIGPERAQVVPRGKDGGLDAPSALVRQAHAAGLLVHPYTLRPENAFLPPLLRGPGDKAARHPAGMIREARALIEAGVDGFFTDDPALGRRAVDDAGR